MEIRKQMVKLDNPTKEIHILKKIIIKAKQDKLNRVYIWVE